MYNFLLPILTVIQCAINADSWKQSLPVCIFGMLGIFIVIGVIVLLTYLLNKATSKKPKDKE
jgi:hypothetical protein